MKILHTLYSCTYKFLLFMASWIINFAINILFLLPFNTMADECLSASVDEFAEVLQEEERWYQLGVFLGASTKELNAISDLKNHSTCDILMLLIQLYDCLEKKGKSLSWENIATALRRIGNHSLAEKIHEQYVKPSIKPEHNTTDQPPHPPSIARPPTIFNLTTSATDIIAVPQNHGSFMTDVTVEVPSEVPVPELHTDPPTSVPPIQNESMAIQSSDVHPLIESEEVCMIANEYETLSGKFANIVLKVKRVVKNENIDLDEIQDVIRRQCGLPPLPQGKTTAGAVFTRIEEQCSILNFRLLEFIVENVLNNGEVFVKQLTTLKKSVETFKSSANMVELVTLIKNKQTTPTGCQKVVKLKLQAFWSSFTYRQFEIIVNEIFQTLYNIMTHITVKRGCICISWLMPTHVDATELLPQLPLEFIRLIGVIYLHIGNEVIYNIEVDGCDSIEAAMIQAIELKNTRAIELLLAVGCSPQVATYNDSNTVTNIVNIRAIESKESSSDGSSGPCVDHVCILGHNEHVEAIIDPNSESKCSSCSMKEKMIKQLHQEVDQQQQQAKQWIIKVKELQQENEELCLTMKEKGFTDESADHSSLSVPEGMSSIKKDDYQKENDYSQAENFPILLKALMKSRSAISVPEGMSSAPGEYSSAVKKDNHQEDDDAQEIKSQAERISTTTADDEDDLYCGDPGSCNSISLSKVLDNENIPLLRLRLKRKDAEITLLKRNNELLIKELQEKKSTDKDIHEHDLDQLSHNHDQLPLSPLPSSYDYDTTTSTTVLPRCKLCLMADMKVKVTTRDKSGKELVTGGSFVRAVLTCNDEECPVTDNNDGTYTITVIPQQLGQHQLSITVNGRYIQDSPFTLDIVPQRDYTILNIEPIQKITDVPFPKYIAFSDNGDMFVTSSNRIHVYNKNGKFLKILARKSGPVEFLSPLGIDIHDNIIYVVEMDRHRIHRLTRKGELIDTFGGFGSGTGQFRYPINVKVSPTDAGKVYITDAHNHCVQVFNHDWSLSHVIKDPGHGEDRFNPMGIVFDLLGNVHITGYRSYAAAVFDSRGQFIRGYGSRLESRKPVGIAIDSFGNCLVNDYHNDTLLIFSPSGVLINSIQLPISDHPYGVSISPVDESIWVAESNSNSLLRF